MTIGTISGTSAGHDSDEQTDHKKMRLTPLILAIATSLACLTTARAQGGDFSPVLHVNDSVITGFEMQQRLKFLQILQFPGDVQAEAEKGLIEDRLRLQAARAQGIVVTPEQIQAGMAEFAGRANLDTDKFIAAIGQGGVEPQTFRDFVRAGIAWRGVVGAKFAGHVTISEADIDRALSADYGRGAGNKVLISEIIMPAQQGGFGPVKAMADKIAAGIHSEAEFAAAARLYSVAPSRDQGGKLGWIPLSNLPAAAQDALSKLGNGQVSAPVVLGNGIGLFQMRGQRAGTDKVNPADVTVDYARFVLPAGADPAAELARLRAGAPGCDDLYRLARGLPADQLQREKLRRHAIPAGLLQVLDGLDANDMALTSVGGQASVIMLCSRNATLPDTPGPGPGAAVAAVAPVLGTTPDGDIIPSVVPGSGFGFGPSRDQIRDELANVRIGHLADAYLARLKADAFIRP